MDWPIVSKIYYNQEITVNYRPEEIRSSMKKSMELDFKLYQKWNLREIVFLKALPLEWKENYVGPFGSGIRNFTLDPANTYAHDSNSTFKSSNWIVKVKFLYIK